MTTSTARITAIIQKFRADLLAKEAQAEHALNTAHAHTLAVIQPALNKLYDQIAQKLASGEAIPASWIYERLRLEHIQLLIQRQIDNYSAVALQQTRMQQHIGSQLGLQSGMQQLQATVPSGVSYTFGVPSTKAIENLVGATQKGSPLADLFNGFGQEAATAVSKALITGLTLGNNPRVVARSVQDALEISRSRALVISRTEMLRAYRSASLETYRANSDVCESWIWNAQLDRRTCISCIMMNGTEHSLDEDLNDHPCGRCARSPKTRGWSDILGSLGVDTGNIEDTRPIYQSGEDWFTNQSEDVQRQILGNAGYNLWKDESNDVTLHSFIGKSSSDDWGDSIYQKSVKGLVK